MVRDEHTSPWCALVNAKCSMNLSIEVVKMCALGIWELTDKQCVAAAIDGQNAPAVERVRNAALLDWLAHEGFKHESGDVYRLQRGHLVIEAVIYWRGHVWFTCEYGFDGPVSEFKAETWRELNNYQQGLDKAYSA